MIQKDRTKPKTSGFLPLAEAVPNSPHLRLGGREAFLFSLRAAVAGAAAYLCYRWTSLPGQSWAPISAVLVMESTLRPSLRLSLLRFAGNITGAVCGAGGSLLFGQGVFTIVFGLFITGTICHYTHLDEGRRPAYVAMLIVLTNGNGVGVMNSVLNRLIAVVIGCVVALLVAFAFDSLLKHSTWENDREAAGE